MDKVTSNKNFADSFLKLLKNFNEAVKDLFDKCENKENIMVISITADTSKIGVTPVRMQMINQDAIAICAVTDAMLARASEVFKQYAEDHKTDKVTQEWVKERLRDINNARIALNINTKVSPEQTNAAPPMVQ